MPLTSGGSEVQVKQKYGLPRQKALRATLRREILLIQRNSFIYVFRFFQVILNALMTSTLFFRTTRHPNSLKEANYYMGVLFFSLISMLVSFPSCPIHVALIQLCLVM